MGTEQGKRSGGIKRLRDDTSLLRWKAFKMTIVQTFTFKSSKYVTASTTRASELSRTLNNATAQALYSFQR